MFIFEFDPWKKASPDDHTQRILYSSELLSETFFAATSTYNNKGQIIIDYKAKALALRVLNDSQTIDAYRKASKLNDAKKIMSDFDIPMNPPTESYLHDFQSFSPYHMRVAEAGEVLFHENQVFSDTLSLRPVTYLYTDNLYDCIGVIG